MKELKNLERLILFMLNLSKEYDIENHTNTFNKSKELITWAQDKMSGYGAFNGEKDPTQEQIDELDRIVEEYTTPLEIRKTIQSLRLKGQPIIATSKGYKLAKDKQELNEYIAKRGAEIGREWKALKSMAIENGVEQLLKLFME